MLQGVEFFKQMGAAGEGLVEGPNCVSFDDCSNEGIGPSELTLPYS